MSPTETSVSVVIPTWNRASLVTRALHSVFSQTRAPDEVLVVDDGSSDDTASRVRAEFPSVRLLTQQNRGVSAARNAGIRAAVGEWIALLDSDDEWLPPKLERQLQMVTDETLLCHCDEIWIRRGQRVNAMRKHRKYGGSIFEQCLPLCVISPSAVLLRRRLLDDVGLFDEALPACEDYDLWLRVTARFPVLFLDEPLIRKHGGHDDQLSRRYWGMDRFRIAALEKILAANTLDASARSAARAMLAKKISIYATGAKKRGRLTEAQEYESKLDS